MKLDKGYKILSDLFARPLADLGFSKSEGLAFIRDRGHCLEDISFGGRLNHLNQFCYSFGVGVRFESVEKLLRPERSQFCSTFGCGVHLLRPSRDYTEWTISDEDKEFDLVTKAVIEDVQKYALPFLQRFSDMNELKCVLESDDSKEWLTFTSEQRLETLAALRFVLGHKEDALKTIEEALKEREKALPKYRIRFQKLRERLLAL